MMWAYMPVLIGSWVIWYYPMNREVGLLEFLFGL